MSMSTEIADFLIDDDKSETPTTEADPEQNPPAPQEEDSAPTEEEEETAPCEQQIEDAPPTTPQSEAEDPAPEAAAPSPDLQEGIDAILNQLGNLADQFAHKLRYDETKQTIIDRQHEELERYRQDASFTLSKAIIMDVISEVDSAEKSSKFYEPLDCTPENYAKLKKLMLGIADDLRDLLERNDIYSYRSEIGDPFNAKKHRVLKTVPTGDETLAKTIQESVRWGFENADKVIRHELVNVYAYDPSLATPAEAPDPKEPERETEPSPEA